MTDTPPDERAAPEDQDRDEMAHQAPPEPDRSRTFRFFRFVVDHFLLVAGAVVGLVLLASVALGAGLPRWLRLMGVVAAVTLPLVGRPTGKKVASMLWDPTYVWLVDVDARYREAGIFRIPAQRFREWEVADGSLDWVSPHLAFGKDVDLEDCTVKGCWRGTLSDRELMRSLQAVEECRGQLEDDAKRGFAIESQAFTIIRNATRSAVMSVISTFERGTLPDDGDGISAEIDSAISQFDLERKIRKTEDDDSPQSEVPGLNIDVEDHLADLSTDGADGGVRADD